MSDREPLAAAPRRHPGIGALLVAAGATFFLLSSCSAQSTTPEDTKPIDCRGDNGALPLAAQAVLSAIYVPCLATIPVGWSFGGSQIKSGSVRFWLDSDRAGFHAVEVTLTKTCDRSGAVQTPQTSAPEPGMTRFELPLSLPPNFAMERFDVFAGGCVTYRYAFATGASSLLVFDLDPALSYFARSVGVQRLKELGGLTLCGAEAPPCPG
jgi:hypothetical protein